ncbi:MAG: alanine/glycine:cation symporter family protein [Cardiobacteriaceae bacterium]|nr:alanine/glycine:cation symporter family protein [Cardiobacteriaceae bacterium]
MSTANLEAAIAWLNGLIWSPVFIWLCLGVGLFFSLMTRFAQVRHFAEMWRLLFRTDNSSEHGISSFQALAVSLSGRVGIGNIAGVAAAIGFGGPGAVFWMWVVAFLGASTAYVESTLGQIYKIRDTESTEYQGGPAYYFERCLGWRWYGILFAMAAVISCGLFLHGAQANGVTNAMVQVFGEGTLVNSGIASGIGTHRLIATAFILVLLGFIIFGGIKRIANFAQVVVPFMALAYIILALIVVFINIDRVPELFGMIIKDAFNPAAGLGAAIGWGVKRGIYSNEAGQGTGAHAAAAAEVEHPVQQGLVQAFSVYIDTLFVCTATALMILMTKQYNVVADQTFSGAGTQYIIANLRDASGVILNVDPSSPAFTQNALHSVFGHIGPILVAFATFFFAFTTILAYYYIAEINIVYLARKIGFGKGTTIIVKISTMFAVAYGSISSSGYIWNIGDIGVGMTAWLNIIGLLIIFFTRGRPTIRALRDYERQQKENVAVYTFNPQALGIKNAHFWEERWQANQNNRPSQD